MSKNKKTPSRAVIKRNEREDKRKKSIMESDGTRTTWERILWMSGCCSRSLFSSPLFRIFRLGEQISET